MEKNTEEKIEYKIQPGIESRIQIQIKSGLLILLLLVITVAATTAGSIFVRLSLRDAMVEGVVTICLFGILFFVYINDFDKGFGPDKNKSITLFACFYVVGLIVSLCSNFASVFLLPIAAVSLFCMLYSNEYMGIITLLLFDFLSNHIRGMDFCSFCYIFLVGFCMIMLFKRPKKETEVISRALIVLFLSIPLYVALILLKNYSLDIMDIIYPIATAVFQFVAIVLFFKVYTRKYFEKYDDIYEKINDPEYTLLIQLKEKDKYEYLTTIHTAYLCDKIAAKLHKDHRACKALGYYRKLGVGSIEGVPPVVEKLAREYKNSAKYAPQSAETVIAILSNDIVSSIRGLAKQRGSEVIDYDKIIDFIFAKKEEKRLFANCDMTMKEIMSMKNCFKEEKLYYDFLR